MGWKTHVLLGTSPGRRLESNAFKVSKELFPHFGANIVADFYLPSFNHFFKDRQIVEPTQKEEFNIQLQKFQTHLSE